MFVSALCSQTVRRMLAKTLDLGPSPPTSRSRHQVTDARRDAQVQRERAEKAVSR